MSVLPKILIGLSLLLGVVLVAVINSKMLSFDAKRNGLLLEIIGNVSHGLDKLDTGIETIMSETKIAKGRLGQLVALHRENLVACAAQLRNKRAERSTRPPRDYFELLIDEDRYEERRLPT